MAYEHLCMYCFEDLQGQAVCPHCGRDSRAAVPQIQMLPGTLVYHDRFLVGRALGQDATGIVYAAFDTKRENKMRLREYLPRDCAERLNDGSVVPTAGLEDQFEKGMRKLRASVEGVEDPKKRHFYFEENGTAYIAQRKTAAAAAAVGAAADEDTGSGFKQIGVIVGIAAAVVVVAAIVIVSLVNGALNSSNDVVQNATLAPNSTTNLWAPEVTASPTPYVSPTFAALVDPEQSWMDYTYSGDVNKEFQNQLNQSATATPKPSLGDSDDDDYKTVNKNSSTAAITTLQQRLASLGWLSAEKITGKYDSATKQAVKDFQTYVNNTFQPAEKLSVDGVAGPKTQQWLYATEAVKPTPTPTPAVTADPNEGTVDKDSSKTDIKAVQRKLIVLGLMSAGSDDGVYGTTTTAAVKKFQQRVNQLQGYEALEVTGVVDPDTMAYLNYYVEWWESLQQATATPEPVLPTTPAPTGTPAPTDAPDKEEDGFHVDKDSPKESIRYVQQMLIEAGLLPTGSDDGDYGAATATAMLRFQQYVNDYFQGDVLPEDGVGDSLTLSYLEEFVSRGMTVPKDEPTATPTPTDAPRVELSLSVGGTELMNGVHAVTGDSVTFNWSATGAVSDYYIYVYKQNGDVFYQNEATDRTNGSFGADSLTPGEVYTISIGALPEGGDESDMVWTEAQFGVPAADPTATPEPDPTATPEPDPTDEPVQDDGSITPDSSADDVRYMQQLLISAGVLKDGSADGDYGNGTKNAVLKFQQYVNDYFGDEVLDETGIADANTMKYLEEFVNRGMTVPSDEPTAAPEPDPTATPEPDPTDEPEPDPTDAPDPTKTPIPVIAINDVEYDEEEIPAIDVSVPTLFSWTCEGDVQGFMLYMTNSAGQKRELDKTRESFVELDMSSLPADTYSLFVGAVPSDATSEADVVWSSIMFTIG